MTEQKQTENLNKTKSTKILVVSIIIIVAAIGIGMVIRGLRPDSTETEPVAQVDEIQNNIPEENTQVVYTIPPVIEESEPVEEVAVEPESEPEPEPVRVQPPVYNNENNAQNYYDEQLRQDVTQWVSWLQTLSEEERTALFRGSIATFMQLMQRWQTIPPEQAEEERVFLENLIQGWRDLPVEDRQQGIENIQYQLEQWLQSGQI